MNIKSYIETNLLNKSRKLNSRKLKFIDPEIIKIIEIKTSFLVKPELKDRIKSILKNISEHRICPVCNSSLCEFSPSSGAVFRNTCSNKCASRYNRTLRKHTSLSKSWEQSKQLSFRKFAVNDIDTIKKFITERLGSNNNILVSLSDYKHNKLILEDIIVYSKSIKIDWSKSFYDIINQNKPSTCVNCGSQTKYINMIKGYQLYCSRKCSSIAEGKKKVQSDKLKNIQKIEENGFKVIRYSKLNDTIKLKCEKCDNISDYIINNGKINFKINCKKCSNKSISLPELEITEFIGDCETQVRIGEINKKSYKSIDIIKNNLGVEYNGLMWHSFGKHKSSMFNNNETEKERRTAHLNKTELCEEQNIQLFHIFENEWLDENKKLIWKSMFNNKLRLNDIIRVYARKCTIREITSSESSSFLDINHLQGSGISKIKIGLFYNEELISVMTFGKSRFNKNIEYELIRYASKLNHSIPGGASKLLKYFERNYNPKSLISYANRRWSTSIESQSSVYDKLGFEFSHNTTPNYFYFDKSHILWSRNKFQKHKLKNLLKDFDSKLTETQNMYNNGYRKIYDSGNKVYVKYYKYIKS